MCGVCGIFDTKKALGDVKPVLRRMTDAIRHRGPDEEGYLEESNIALGHRRLKVIDLLTGRQPMTSQNGRVTVVFNGEIYNFKQIRETLEKSGRKFVTHSDTESLLQLFEEKGIDCVGELEGMFAFAAYDRSNQALYLAVDRFGKKPLYYFLENGLFLFASELKSLLKHPAVSRTMDPQALAEYLAFEYVPAPRTILKNVSKMEAAAWLCVSKSGIQKKRYWQPDFKLSQKTQTQWVDEFLVSYEASVRKRLVSDVPLGVFLSGGLDSSSVVAMARAIEPEKKLKTFTIEFDEASFDESQYAKEVSQVFKTEHFSEKCSMKQMLEEQESILSHLDEPFADASFIPTFMLCRLARSHVTVALSGDGGDEIFAGYPTFIANKAARFLDKFPGFFLKSGHAIVNRLPASSDYLSFDFKLKQFFKGLSYHGLVRDQVWLGSFSDREEALLLAPPLLNFAEKAYQVFDEKLYSNAEDPMQKLQEFYFRFYLEGDILVKTDRASMAHSLEVRSPLLDDSLVQLTLQMPFGLKMKGMHSKYLFKKSMRGRLPSRIIHRKKKGFGVPIARWIREDLRQEFQNVLSEERIRKDGLFNASQVDLLLKEHLSGKMDHRKKLWTLYVFQKWKKNYLDG